jgi:hypothetical protein
MLAVRLVPLSMAPSLESVLRILRLRSGTQVHEVHAVTSVAGVEDVQVRSTELRNVRSPVSVNDLAQHADATVSVTVLAPVENQA